MAIYDGDIPGVVGGFRCKSFNVGDWVRYLGGPFSFPEEGHEVQVYSTGADVVQHEQEDGMLSNRYDFSVLHSSKVHDMPIEHNLDSRYFVLVDSPVEEPLISRF